MAAPGCFPADFRLLSHRTRREFRLASRTHQEPPMKTSRAVDRTSSGGTQLDRREFMRLALAGGAGVLSGGLGALLPKSLLAASPSDWIEATIPQLQSLFQSRALTSVELTTGYLSRIAQLNPLLAAVIETNP